MRIITTISRVRKITAVNLTLVLKDQDLTPHILLSCEIITFNLQQGWLNMETQTISAQFSDEDKGYKHKKRSPEIE